MRAAWYGETGVSQVTNIKSDCGENGFLFRTKVVMSTHITGQYSVTAQHTGGTLD